MVVEDGSMQCGDHPYRSNPGGICAFCLQEKLGMLVNSSKSSSTTLFFPIPHSASSSRISPPSLGSSAAIDAKTHASTTAKNTSTVDVYSPDREAKSHRPRLPFFFHGIHPKGRRRRKKKNTSSVGSTPAATSGRKNTTTGTITINTSATANRGSEFVLKRCSSVSTTTASTAAMVTESPRKRWFWSFRHSSSDPKGSNGKHQSPHTKDHQQKQQQRQQWSKVSEAMKPSSGTREEELKREVVEETEESPSGSSQISNSLGRKVARSRSVGCGSRSFSSDLLDRMSTGLGDCALRRVESQRDPKPKTAPGVEEDDSNTLELKRQQRVRCGGIFGGFGVVSSSSCSSSSFWLPLELGICGGSSTPHRRPRSWGWVFASPSRPLRSSSNKPSPTLSGKPSSANDNISTSIPAPTTSIASL